MCEVESIISSVLSDFFLLRNLGGWILNGKRFFSSGFITYLITLYIAGTQAVRKKHKVYRTRVFGPKNGQVWLVLRNR